MLKHDFMDLVRDRIRQKRSAISITLTKSDEMKAIKYEIEIVQMIY